MINLKTTHEYRGVEYHYEEWTTWNNKQASGYICEDKSLLSKYHIQQTPAQTEEEMLKKIDYFIDCEAEILYRKDLHERGAAAYYASKGNGEYTGD